MANMFRCTLASGGALVLTVTCDYRFSGSLITCTDGTNTFTETCPSSSPYEVTFSSISIGTWTVSGEFEGVIYSEQIVISNFTLNLLAGFGYKQWVTLGGLDPTDYASLSEVFADEVAVRRLMTIHASADYLIEKVTDDIDTIDDFVANDTAMKWIGLRDYVCDGLTAITGVEAKFLASQYWERYLKDHVPVMTSNTAPYGTASAISEQSINVQAFRAFDDSGPVWCSNNSGTASNIWLKYAFVNPIKALKVKLSFDSYVTASTYVIQGSKDGTNYTDLTETLNQIGSDIDIEITKNADYYLHYRLYLKTNLVSSNVATGRVSTLQFYGRALDVSVPVMTSNTAPYGEASASSAYSGRSAYYAFSNGAVSANFAFNTNYGWIQYEFTKKIAPKYVLFTNVVTANQNPTGFSIIGINDGVSQTIKEFTNTTTNAKAQLLDLENDRNEYKIIRLDVPSDKGSENAACNLSKYLQFYGVDYSEREFETGSTKKWLYDHGVELETFTYGGNSSYKVIAENDGESIHLKSSNGAAGVLSAYAELANFDFSDYDLIRANVGDVLTTTSTASNGRCCSVIIYNQGTTTNSVASKAIEKGSSILPNNISLDVSSLNTSYDFYIIDSNNGAAESKVKELWLE